MKDTALSNHSKLPPRPVFHVVAESDCALVVMVVVNVMVLLVVGNMRVMMIMEEVEAKYPSSLNPQTIIR